MISGRGVDVESGKEIYRVDEEDMKRLAEVNEVSSA